MIGGRPLKRLRAPLVSVHAHLRRVRQDQLARAASVELSERGRANDDHRERHVDNTRPARVDQQRRERPTGDEPRCLDHDSLVTY
jgi:hypothetical protein